MSTTAQRPGKSQLCSIYSREIGEDPAGSAPSWERCLVLEFPNPWKDEVTDSAHFPTEVSDALAKAEAKGRPVRLQCVTPDPEYTAAGHTRIMLFYRDPAPASAFSKIDYVVPSDRAAELAVTMIENSDVPRNYDQYRDGTDGVRDILVCTHGSRDTCCATFGIPIYQILHQEHGPASDGHLRVWRASHLGGHRLAPNIVDLPEGRNWVRPDVSQLDALVYRRGDISDVSSLYRGLVRLNTPYEQAAEGAVLMQEGWGWTGRKVSTSILESTEKHARVRVEATSEGGGKPPAYDVTVVVSGTIQTVACLTGENKAVEEQYAVTRLSPL
jgi:hypothetical protein